MTAAVSQRFTGWSNRVRTEAQPVMHLGDAGVAVKRVIAGPIADHRRTPRAKAFVNLIVMPQRKLRRRQPFGVARAQQPKRPSPAFILDVGDHGLREEMRA